MIEAIFFDIGNVLLAFDYSRAARRLLPHTDKEAHVLMGELLALRDEFECGRMMRGEFVRHARRITGFPGGDAELEEIYSDIFDPIPATWSLVERLAPRYPLFLLSNTSEIHLEFIRRKFPVFHHFSAGVFSHESGCMKPDPRIYKDAIQLASAPPDRLVFLDDMAANVAAASAAGFHTHQYDAGRHDESETFLRRLGVSW